MKKLRITIKCVGLNVRTNDLEMGLGILDQITKHGIMNHSFISNKLLAKANSIIEHAAEKLAMFKILDKVKKGFKMPNFAPKEDTQEEELVDEATSEEPESEQDIQDYFKTGIPKSLRKETTSEETPDGLPDKKQRMKGYKQIGWTIKEDKLLCDLMKKKSPKQVASRKDLLKRHTAGAIKTRLSIYRNFKWDRLNEDRANVMHAYLSGEQISTPVVDINKAVPTPVVDQIEQKTMSNGSKAWTAEEEQLLIDNSNKLKGKKLYALFPDRTSVAIQDKRHKLSVNGKVKSHPMTRWTEQEVDAIEANMRMTPKELATLPWLKNRTINQITQKKYGLQGKK